MRLIALALAFVLFSAETAQAQILFGPATVIDGDTVQLTGTRIRLHGIDAPESAQTCTRDGQEWACGAEATLLLGQLIDGRSLQCQQHELDDYGRVVATCTADRMDLAEAMVNAGFAVALTSFSETYVDNESRARENRLGIWASTFAMPADYRAERPDQFRRPNRPVEVPPTRGRSWRAAPATVSYRNCAQARAAGAAPLYRGQPGYRIEMDGDGDGIACEPYRGRR